VPDAEWMVQGSCSGRLGEVGQFTPFIIILAILLLIPAIILLGHRRPHGSIVLSSGAAIVVFAVFWLLGGTVGLYEGSTSADMVKVYIIQFLLLGGLVLLIASWTLSLNAAAQARRWLWQALLVLAGLITFCMVLLLIFIPPWQMPCFFMQNSTPDSTNVLDPGAVPVCQPVNPLIPILIIAGYFVGPVAALLSAVRPSLLARRTLGFSHAHQLPEGLTVSRLGAADEPTIESDLP